MDTSTRGQRNADDTFDREITGLTAAAATEIVDLTDGDTFDLVAAPIRKRIGDDEVLWWPVYW